MSPTPVTFATPNQPSSYTWEATDEEVAARYGVAIEDVVRFDVNTAPLPPDLAQRVMAAGRFPVVLSEYPPSDYRLLVEAAAERYGVGTDELVVGAGADEILDVIAKTFLVEGSRAVIPVPTYAMYRVVTEQRAADVVAVPRLGPGEGYALDIPRMREAALDAAVLWLCSPNNPTALAEPDGVIETLLGLIEADATAEGRPVPIVVLDEAYEEFVGRSSADLRFTHRNLIVIRTASKAYALAGLRVGFAIARSELVARMNPIRPPASISTVSATVVTEALKDDALAATNVALVTAERERLTAALTRLGWSVGPSVTNFVLVDLGTVDRATAAAEALLRRGLVPRTFPDTHPLADHLRLTVRSPEQNDRLIAAASDFEAPSGRA
ncbi:MAG TPA: histidinol-phosphate transaminase [Candidatus Limnocylindrales bacterium]|nr:histidinol-phosphate transaminase [Candidatus Limnocylindrales bacterium]